MCDIESNVKISWQLVSQFVSWDFCRYTCEQNEAEPNEADVLTFLRNMIVERTEKAALDITKHEIVAKFIMESKTIKTISRMPCLEALAESVKKIVPNLSRPVEKLLDHYETFLNKLEDNECSERIEMLEARMAHAVKEFSEEACLVLPTPDLLQVVQTSLQTDSQPFKRKINYPENIKLYRSVLTCLQKEIKECEIETICQSLYDDHAFKKFMYKSTLGDGADSQILSTQSSQAPADQPCSDSLQLSQRYKLPDFLPPARGTFNDNSLTLDSIPPVTPYKQLPDSEQSLDPSCLPIDPSKYHQLAEKIDKLGALTQSEASLFEDPNPLPLATALQPPGADRETISSFADGYPRRSFVSGAFSPSRISDSIVVSVQPYCEESDESDCCYMTQKPAKLRCEGKKFKKFVERTSESEDTSDCDKDPEFIFLTPTLFKKGCEAPPAIYLSDQESFNSSIVTTFIDSQKNDPTFKARIREPLILSPQRSKNQKKSSKKKKVKPKNSKNKSPIQTTLQQFATFPRTVTVPNLNDSHTDFQKNVGKKKKLFNPDAPASSLNSKSPSPLIRKRKTSRDIIQAVGNKRRCTDCKITFKTPNELKKHVFIFHTEDDFSD